MTDLTRPWPLGLDGKTWWVSLVFAAVLLGVALTFDHTVSVWAVSWPKVVRDTLAQITPYGESDWILYPSGFLFVITAIVALLVRWKLMRTLLWQFTELYAFIFVGVGLPSLVSTIAKRVIGRGRPMHFDQGLFVMHANALDWTYQSMPSGHATTAFALAATIGFISERWFYPTLAFASAIALSRITEGVHYPSDVLVGAALGFVGAYAVRWFFARRGWMFRAAPDGTIHARPMSSLKRYLKLKQRGSAPGPKPSQP